MALTSTLPPPTPSLPTSNAAPLPEAGPAASLEERIQAAEARLLQREQDLTLRWQQLTRRVRLSMSPRRWAKPVTIGAVSLLGLWLLLRPSRKPEAPGQRPAVSSQRSGHAARARRGRPLWLRALVLSWPMLPAPWRARMSPGTTAAVMTIGLPLAERLFGYAPGPEEEAPLQTMARVDLRRFAGTWYEIARLPMPFESVCEGQPSATYEVMPGGEVRVVNRCRSHDGSMREVAGVATVLPNSGNAKLEVSLWPVWLRWLPLAWAKYWILFVDGDYEVAVVGHPDRRFLWLLSRTPQLAPARIDTLVHIAASQGFPVERLQYASAR